VPEWYFLPFYAILRAIPDKLLGVVAMFGSILLLFVLPWLDTSRVRSATFRPIYKIFFWLILFDCALLTWCGAQLPEGLPLTLSRIGTFWYFLHFLVLLPVIGWLETPKPLPASIGQPVLKPAE
ncbi:MAG: cytochrome b, partial [Rhodobacteraceae bacterium]|nr:cytochrome b [Paracoccaceae bacterium]